MTPRPARPAELIRRTAQALATLYATLAGDDGLTLSQFAVLDVLLRHGPRPAASLTGLTGIDKSTMFLMIHRMSDAGLVAAVAMESPLPGRNPMAVTLTPRGRKALERAEEAVWKAEMQVMGRLSPTERSQFLNSLAIAAFTVAPK